MEINFLKENHHNLFENKTLQFKKYICKDCTAKKSEYEHDNSENIPKEILIIKSLPSLDIDYCICLVLRYTFKERRNPSSSMREFLNLK